MYISQPTHRDRYAVTIMRVLTLIFLLTLPAVAKERPQYTYQDGVLQSFRTEHAGQTCSSSGSVDATSDTSATTSSSTSCRDTERALYTVKSGENTFILTPDHSAGAKAGLRMVGVWSSVVESKSVLANRMPGTALQLRGDGKHYFIKIGDRESMFAAVGAQ